MQATKHPLVSKVSDLQASSWDAEFVVIKYCTIVHRLLCISQMETVPVTRFVARIKQRRTFFLSFFFRNDLQVVNDYLHLFHGELSFLGNMILHF